MADGTQEYWKNGVLHRDGDLPAIVWEDGTKEYWKNGVKYTPTVNPYSDKVVEIDGKKYKLTPVPE